MNQLVLQQAVDATIKGSMHFGEIVQIFIREGVEYYHVDYISKKFSFYDALGSVLQISFSIENLSFVSLDFSITDLKNAIFDSQHHEQSFSDFSVRAVKAGVQSYYVFLVGARVLYIGRKGDQHVEYFP